MEATIKPAGRRRIVTLATAILTIMIVGVAFAAWTATGDGTGQATALDPDDNALVVTIKDVTGLYPTQEAQDLEVNVENPYPYNVSITDIEITDVSTEVPGCNADHITIGGPYSYVLDSQVVGSDNDDLDFILADALQMTNAADDECQGASFDVDVRVEGESTGADAS
jgi:hypothetical protein